MAKESSTPSTVSTMNPSTIVTKRKIGNITVNVRSNFYPEKSLSDILFSIVSARLKEKSE